MNEDFTHIGTHNYGHLTRMPVTDFLENYYDILVYLKKRKTALGEFNFETYVEIQKVLAIYSLVEAVLNAPEEFMHELSILLNNHPIFSKETQ